MASASTTGGISALQTSGTWGTTGNTPEGLGSSEFFQERVARYALIAGSLGFLFFSFRVVIGLFAFKFEALLLHPSMLYHLGGVMPYVAVWILTRAGRRKRKTVKWLEALGVVLSSISYMAMGSYLSIEFGAHMVVLLALTFGLVARSIFVPSTARFTLLLCVAIGIPLIVIFNQRFLAVSPEFLALIRNSDIDMSGASVELTRAVFARGETMGLTVWWSLTCILCTVTSAVIYGLRAEATRALHLGQYTLVQKIGEGGMGAVYRAEHAMLRRPTAVKLLLPAVAGTTTIARFEREVQLTAELSHPNTITIFDYGRTPEGVFYYAMELLEGATLETVVDIEGALPAARIVHLLRQIAGALFEAHNRGLIHRDIKPGNIILCERGGIPDTAKVVDFGLVKAVKEEENAMKVTQANIVTGTPLYMSPEMIAGPESIDARSDIYSLGALAYFMITGKNVFSGNTMVEVCGHHLHTVPEAPSARAGIPVDEALERLVLDCLEKKPDDRPANMAVFSERLDDVELLDEWTSEQAAKWWTDNLELLAKIRSNAEETHSGHTLAIDLRARG